jgi:polysaccharide biosynthesis protein PslH
LFLAPESPYPIAGGGALRSASLLHYLARTHTVDMIIFRQPGAPDPAGQLPPGVARKVHVVDLPPNGRGAIARALRNAGRMARQVPPLVDRFAGFGDKLTAFLDGEHYRIGVIEHFWCAPYWQQISPVCARTVLDLHNVESVLHARCVEVGKPAQAFAHRVFQRASLELEREWLPRFSSLLTASEPDAERVRAIAPGAHVTAYPNSLPVSAKPQKRDEDAIVFSGNMEYHPNISAVEFFRGNIWPRLREQWPTLVWRLIGKNPSIVKRIASGDPRIEVRGPVENAVGELARAKVAVVPLLAGSGTRLKILEAWAAGVPVVSTHVGAEGLPARDGENMLLACSPDDFARAVSRLLASPSLREQIGQAGRVLLENEFTWESAWEKLNNALGN